MIKVSIHDTIPSLNRFRELSFNNRVMRSSLNYWVMRLFTNNGLIMLVKCLQVIFNVIIMVTEIILVASIEIKNRVCGIKNWECSS
ncbi:hypothetical protein [uncultured Methanobacterium sp.]|uniref:hypothetical protein n=1 Tax=uncultured Methanobacterium sp. TaxID=176306 RepID=UPI002AA82950|nr:hypothetical protein [uncultured Methanobacterium sp.]